MTNPKIRRQVLTLHDQRNRFDRETWCFVKITVENEVLCYVDAYTRVRAKKIKRILGCTAAEFMAHLEKQFKEGMTRKNFFDRVWEVVQLRPTTEAQTRLEFPEYWRYDNLRPEFCHLKMNYLDRSREFKKEELLRL